jgi:hypothetical protein
VASEAVIGLIGVGVGALTSGGVQAMAAWAGRRNDALSSARIIWNRLSAAITDLETMAKTDGWTGFPSFAADLAIWKEERRALARSIGTIQFHSVAAAFNVLETLDTWRESSLTRHRADEGWALFKSKMDRGIRIVTAGTLAAWDAAERRRDKLNPRQRRWLDDALADADLERDEIRRLRDNDDG